MKKMFSLVVILLFVTLIIGCSKPKDTIIQDNITNIPIENLSQEYDKVLIKMQDNNSNPKLDQRYDYLNNQVDKIVQGKKELTMAAFVQTKIEVDFLRLQDYDQAKIEKLWNNFMTAFAKTEESAFEKETGSLNDRHLSISRKIDKITSGEKRLEVSEFLHLEESIFQLEEDGYIPKRIDDLRTKLFQSVILELESAIIDYEPPEDELEIVEEETIPAEIIEKKVPEIEQINVTGPQRHVVFLWDGGFDRENVVIKVGDTVEWMNTREGHFKIALILGNRECRDVKSGLFDSGFSYNYTFTKPGTCYISDGIFTTQAMKVFIRK
jgi:plastocyanin